MFVVNVLLTAAAAASAVVYALYLRMVVRYRKEEPFNSSFFQLTVALGLADLWALLHSYLLVRFPIWGYFHSFYTVNDGQPWLARYMGVTFAYVMSVQFIGVLLLAINRYTAVKYPVEYKGQWKKRLKMAISFQLLFPLVLVIAFLVVPLHQRYAYVVCLDLPHQCDEGTAFQTRIKGGVLTVNGSNEYLFTKTVADETTTIVLNVNQVAVVSEVIYGSESSYQLFLAALNLFYLVIIAATAAANAATIYGLVKHRQNAVGFARTLSSYERQRQEKDRKAERRLTFASLTVFAVFVGVLLCTLLYSVGIVPRMDTYLFWVVVDWFQYMNPYIILACSTSARQRFLQMSGLK